MAGRFSIMAVFKGIDRLTAPVSKMQNTVLKFGRNSERVLSRVNKSFDAINSKMGSGIKFAAKGAGAGLGLLAAGILGVTKAYSTIENAEAAFTPVLGSAERAKDMVKQLNTAAADTPFQFETLAGAAEQLLPNMGGDIEKTIETIKMLGDTAGGNAERLDSITRGFNKALLKGKVDLESLNMIAEAGTPIFQQLQKEIGAKSPEAFFKLVSAGKVTTKQLTEAFKTMTSEGGMFYRGMDIASKTTSGMWSTFVDNATSAAAGIGEVLSPYIKEFIADATIAAQQVLDWVTANKALIQSKAAEYVEKLRTFAKDFWAWLKKINTEQNLLDRGLQALQVIGDVVSFLVRHGKTIAVLIGSIYALSLAFKGLSLAIGIVNMVMALNPIGLIVLAVTAAVAAIGLLIYNWDAVKAAMLRFIDALKEKFKPVSDWFIGVWSKITDQIEKLLFKIDMFKQKIADFKASIGLKDVSLFGGDDDDEETKKRQQDALNSIPVISANRAAWDSYSERRTLEQMELTVKDQTGRVEVTKPSKNGNLTLQKTGGFN